MQFKKILSEAIDNNSKIIITGKSGWGKSEMIQQVAKDKGLELIDFRLSEVLPEDIVGIPKVVGDYYEYIPPRWLYEVLQHPEKKYLLFLDEITQGTPEVLNICYKIFDKVTKIGDHELPNVAVVGATNYSSESNFLSELPGPLKKRACMLELDHNSKDAASYLVDKYSFDDKAMIILEEVIKETNPRSTDKALELCKNKCCKELISPYVGLTNYIKLNTLFMDSANPDELSDIAKALFDITRGYSVYKNEKYKVLSVNMLSYLYDLSPEELKIVDNSMTAVPSATADDIRRDFFTQYAIDNNIEASLLANYALDNPSFNVIAYIKKMPISVDTFDDYFKALKNILSDEDEQLMRLILTHRDLRLPIMKKYRKCLPWDLLREQEKRGYLSPAKCEEFKKELMYGTSNV